MRQIKWTMVAAAAILIVLIGCYVRFVPQSFFHDAKEIEVYRVVQNSGEVRLEITEEVDLEALCESLTFLQCRRYRMPFAPYAQSEVEYEIDGMYRGEHFHILLGSEDVNVIYDSAEKGGYEILQFSFFS